MAGRINPELREYLLALLFEERGKVRRAVRHYERVVDAKDKMMASVARQKLEKLCAQLKDEGTGAQVDLSKYACIVFNFDLTRDVAELYRIDVMSSLAYAKQGGPGHDRILMELMRLSLRLGDIGNAKGYLQNIA